MPNLVQQQEIVQMLSDQQLQTELQQPTGSVPGFLLASEAMRRQSLKQQMASAQAPQETTVVDDLASQMGPQNPPMMRTGGGVRRFDIGGGIGALDPTERVPWSTGPQEDELQPRTAPDFNLGDWLGGWFSKPSFSGTPTEGDPLSPGSWTAATPPPPDPSKPISPLESLDVDPDPFMKAYPPAPRGEDAALRAKEAESAKTEAAMDPDKLRNDRYAKYEQAIKDMYAKAEGDNNMLGYSAGEMAGFAGEMFKPRRAGESNQMYRIAQGLQALNAGYDERQKANKELELRKDAGLLALMQAKDAEKSSVGVAGAKRQDEIYKQVLSGHINQMKALSTQYDDVRRQLADIEKTKATMIGDENQNAALDAQAAVLQGRLSELQQQLQGVQKQYQSIMYRFGQSGGVDTSLVEDADEILKNNP